MLSLLASQPTAAATTALVAACQLQLVWRHKHTRFGAEQRPVRSRHSTGCCADTWCAAAAGSRVKGLHMCSAGRGSPSCRAWVISRVGNFGYGVYSCTVLLLGGVLVTRVQSLVRTERLIASLGRVGVLCLRQGLRSVDVACGCRLCVCAVVHHVMQPALRVTCSCRARVCAGCAPCHAPCIPMHVPQLMCLVLTCVT